MAVLHRLDTDVELSPRIDMGESIIWLAQQLEISNSAAKVSPVHLRLLPL
jgi:hypothetical protein